MKKKKTKLTIISLLVGIGLITRYLIPKNTPIVAHFLNKNSIDIEVDKNLDNQKIKVELSIQGTDKEDIVIVENGKTKSIPKGYGENDWFISYDKKNYGVFRHFKTNNWHDHDYSFSFYKKDEALFCTIGINGPDQMDKRTIKLDKKIKTDIGAESGLRIKKK